MLRLLLIVAFLSAWVAGQEAPNGTYKADLSKTKADLSNTEIYRVGGPVSAPVPIERPQPVYPKKQYKAKKQGTVILDLIVDANGDTKDIEVRRSLSRELDKAAIEAVKKWKFQPATKDGKPVPVRVSVEVDFHLY